MLNSRTVSLVSMSSICLCILFFTLPAYSLDSGRFKHGMVNWLSNIDQSSYRGCTGNLYGLEDEEGKVILPAIYSDIEYCGHGIFLATEVQKWNKCYFGDKRFFFNREGNELDYKIPEGAFLYNIFSFGRRADGNPNLTLDNLAEDTILLFGYKGEPERRSFDMPVQGLCDIHGKILFAPVRHKILFLNREKAFLTSRGKNQILSLRTWMTKPTTLEYNFDKFPRPRIRNSSPYSRDMSFPLDRKLKTIRTDDGTFDSLSWIARRDYPITRSEMFMRFLRKYKFIGMLKDRVAVLLGESEERHSPGDEPLRFKYYFPSYSCTGDTRGIFVYFKKGHVSGWEYFDCVPHDKPAMKKSQLYTDNIYYEGKEALSSQLLPTLSTIHEKIYFPSRSASRQCSRISPHLQ